MRIALAVALLLLAGSAAALKPCFDICHLGQGTPLLLADAGEVLAVTCRRDAMSVRTACVLQRFGIDGRLRDEEPWEYGDEQKLEQRLLSKHRVVRLEYETPWKALDRPYVHVQHGRKAATLRLEKDTVVLTPISGGAAQTRALGCVPTGLSARAPGIGLDGKVQDPLGVIVVVATCPDGLGHREAAAVFTSSTLLFDEPAPASTPETWQAGCARRLDIARQQLTGAYPALRDMNIWAYPLSPAPPPGPLARPRAPAPDAERPSVAAEVRLGTTTLRLDVAESGPAADYSWIEQTWAGRGRGGLDQIRMTRNSGGRQATIRMITVPAQTVGARRLTTTFSNAMNGCLAPADHEAVRGLAEVNLAGQRFIGMPDGVSLGIVCCGETAVAGSPLHASVSLFFEAPAPSPALPLPTMSIGTYLIADGKPPQLLQRPDLGALRHQVPRLAEQAQTVLRIATARSRALPRFRAWGLAPLFTTTLVKSASAGEHTWMVYLRKSQPPLDNLDLEIDAARGVVTAIHAGPGHERLDP